MKRRASERGISTDNLPSKQQRIVRRKRPSPSHDLEPLHTTKPREIRTTSSGLYTSKYDQSHNSKYGGHENRKYTKFEHRSGGGSGKPIDDRLSGKSGFVEKSRHEDYSLHHHERDHVTSARGSGGHHPPLKPGGHYLEKFDYSLRVANIDFNLPDTEVKHSLISKFKRYGHVNIKVVGFGKERHGFINFTREDDARTARKEMNKTMFHGRPLEVNWSRSTLNRFPDLLTGGHREPRSAALPVKKRLLSSVDDLPPSPPPPFDSYGEHERTLDPYPASRSSRDISYRSSVNSPSHERTHPSSDSQNTTTSKAVLDPNATRTLFVGNLEVDITERELRDLFSPYGRIESVDIKTQRSNNTAYAFVKFFVINDAMNAKNDMHGRQYGELRLKIGFGKGNPSIKVWIGNISSYGDVSEIRKELDRFGLIRKMDYIPGDSHCIAHFDSTEAAEAAASSLSKFRFRSTKKLLKIDIFKTQTARPDLEDYELEFQNVSSDSHTPNWTHPPPSSHGGGAGSSGGKGAYKSRVSRDQNNGHHAAYNNKSMSGRIVSESGLKVTQRSGSDHSYEKLERNNYRKRNRSPDLPSSPQFETSSTARGGSGNGSVGNLNGDLHHRPKRPRNGFDAYEYHKMYGHRNNERPGTTVGASGGGANSNRERYSYDRRGRDRGRENGFKWASPSSRSNEHRSGGGISNKSRDERSSNQTENEDCDLTQNNDVTTSATPLPAPPTIDMLSNDTADTALKLSDSTDPSSPNGSTKSGEKPDLTTLTPESFADLAKFYPVAWKGNLVLKNTGFPTRMHLIGGDPAVAETLARNRDGRDDFSSLRITQRLRLEPPRLDEVNKRVASAGPSGHCVLLALPGPTPNQCSSSPDSTTNHMQLRPLKSLVSYLKQKEAAGIVALNVIGAEKGSSSSDNGAMPDSMDKDVGGVLHAFPPCEFSLNQLLKIVPNLGDELPKEDHIVVLLVKGTV